MSDRLSPGCTSTDGGLDHGLETACDELCDDIETPEEAQALRAMLPALRNALKIERALAKQEAEHDYELSVAKEMASRLGLAISPERQNVKARP